MNPRLSYLWDGSRGRLRAHPASQDRAASPSGLSRFASSQCGIALRGALHDYLGVGFMILLAAWVLFA